MTGDKETRETIAYGYKSDIEIADMARMLMRNDLNHEAVCTATRDRIMYLSQQVEKWKGLAVEASKYQISQEAIDLLDSEFEKERKELSSFKERSGYDSGRIPEGKTHIKIHHVLRTRQVKLRLLDDYRREVQTSHVNISSENCIRVKLKEPMVGLWIVEALKD